MVLPWVILDMQAWDGCIIRDRNGKFIRAACSYLGITCNNTAELQAINLGINLAGQLGIEDFTIQTDSKYAFNCIYRNQEATWNHKEMVMEIEDEKRWEKTNAMDI